MRKPPPSRPPLRARRGLAALLTVTLTVSACTWSDDEPEGDALRSTLAEVRRDLPADLVAAIEQLVVDVHLGQPPRAQAAVAEILRRSGVPVVASDGPVVAAPDEVVLLDVPIYAEFLPALTEAVRAGDRYSVDQFATILQVTKVTKKPLTFAELAGAVAGWGKEPGDQAVFVAAGAAVRALGAARGEVLHARADRQAVFLDPLQVVLLTAHAGSRFTKVKAGARPAALAAPARPGPLDRLLGVGVAHADPKGLCGELAALLENPSAIVTANANFLKGELQERLLSKVLGEKNKERFDKASATAGILGTAISSILLMLGSRVQLKADKTKTHFKHQAGSRAEHVKITAKATFDFKVAAKKLECYSLAGVSIPEAGPLEDFTIRWSSSQPRAGTIQEGNALLTAISADSRKFTNGEKTGKNGESTLEVKPPVEDPAGEGAELTGQAVFTATLDKENFPFSLDDLWALAKGVSEKEAGVASFAILKSYELIAELLTKAGLPEQSIAIDVDYHGADIVLAKGSNSVNLLLAQIPKVYVDLVSCSGVKGPYKGTGGFGGAKTDEFFRQAWAQVFGVNAPTKTPAQDARIGPVTVADDGHPNAFLIMKGEGGKQFLDGQISIYPQARRDSPILANKIAYYDGWKIGRPVGEVEILLAGKSFPFSDLSWPVLRVRDDPRCPAVEYKYDNL